MSGVLDLLNDDAFSLVSLTAAVNNAVYKPGRLGEMGLFEAQGINTTSVAVEVEDEVLSLVPVTSRGSVGASLDRNIRQLITFPVPHLPQNEVILADTLQNSRQFGTENQLESLQAVVNKKIVGMTNKNQYTLESHRIAAVQGSYMSATGALSSAYTAFGITETVVPMGLTSETTELRDKCNVVVDAIEEALGGLSYEHIHCLCGKEFWKSLIAHAKVKETYLASVGASELRGDGRESFQFGSILFERYNGTSAVAIEATEARAFPVGVMDFFITRFAPANYAETVNTEGLPFYAKQERMKFDKGVELEVQSNPFNICARPKALIKLKRAVT